CGSSMRMCGSVGLTDGVAASDTEPHRHHAAPTAVIVRTIEPPMILTVGAANDNRQTLTQPFGNGRRRRRRWGARRHDDMKITCLPDGDPVTSSKRLENAAIADAGQPACAVAGGTLHADGRTRT